jgi:hypothetical protein
MTLAVQALKAAEKGDQHAAPARKRQHTAAANVDLHDLSLLGKHNSREQQQLLLAASYGTAAHAYVVLYYADIILKHSNAIDKAVEVSNSSWAQPGRLLVAVCWYSLGQQYPHYSSMSVAAVVQGVLCCIYVINASIVAGFYWRCRC